MSYRVLIVPGFHGSGEAHWQTWLQAQLPQASRVEGIDWEKPAVHTWANAVAGALHQLSSPTVVVAHSFGCLATSLAIAKQPHPNLAVILVAPARPERFSSYGVREHKGTPSIAGELPDKPLDVPGLVIGSQNDPWMKLQHAYAWSRRWGLAFHDAGEVGHINVDSGFGPWPWIKAATEFVGTQLSRDEPIPTESQKVAERVALNRNLHGSTSAFYA